MPNEIFDDFFRREFPRLIAFLRKTGFEFEQSADAAAEAMTDACQRWSTLTTPNAWVRTAAYRFASNQAQRYRTGMARAVSAGWLVHSEDDTGRLAEIEERPAVRELLARLAPRQQQVMAWHLDGFGTAEIAAHTGMSPATVRSHLRHARDALRSMYEDARPDVESATQDRTAAKEVPHHGSPG